MNKYENADGAVTVICCPDVVHLKDKKVPQKTVVLQCTNGSKKFYLLPSGVKSLDEYPEIAAKRILEKETGIEASRDISLYSVWHQKLLRYPNSHLIRLVAVVVPVDIMQAQVETRTKNGLVQYREPIPGGDRQGLKKKHKQLVKAVLDGN